MPYCTKCGTLNDDDADFCKQCGTPVVKAPAGGPGMYPPGYELDRRGGPPGPGPERYREKDWDKQCEQDCSEGGRKHSWFWGAIIILVGVFIIFEMGVKNVEGLPRWVYDLDLWWVVPVLIGVFIVMVGIESLNRSGRQGG